MSFEKLHEAIKELDGAGTVFVPGDVESVYESYRESEDGWPEWAEVEDRLLSDWYWRKGIQEFLTERGFEIIGQMISESMHEYRKDQNRA